MTAHVARYLVDGTLPPRGTVCPANPNPFVPVAAARLAESMGVVGVPPLRPLNR